MSTLASIVKASRPVSWINTAFPFAAGYLMVTREIDAVLVVGTLFFLIPYNLLMYGINDVFDYESDLANPRKGGIEGDVIRDRERARSVHRAILWACAVTVLPPMVWLLLQGGVAAAVTLVLVVFGVIAYSAPGLRFKEKPFLDSLTSALHFCGPLLYALVIAGASLTAPDTWPIWVAFILWGMASHAFGAVQDVRADREGGIGSVATVIGARATVWFALALYAASSLLLLLLPWPGTLAAVLPLAYVASVARFTRVTDATCEDANRGWRTFLWLNQPVGFAVTMLLIVAWNGWL
ncbi:prenyltransferase [Demequina sp. SYSU T00039]|uniref:Prenyltransferase n=1 Tax=Demequina lignilytica TaxID=3051663 RepID=A0AAW7M3J5_9MICO|nr:MULTISPECIES: prenyltransferase [unclassified Demequina]MDN4477781.1 prenyltransferase [Demequina sp. SYSU T00039-1]MDN4487690.1 prenyltransferase [Demequina sp. SYSU T00039]MDN4491401.1 prenyltransferase [Demequina sp. SYSU T00068]